ncbi:uncharacterized protein TNCV_799181 [Trichonephila clavipes]|nr:uncharacterized protein TNCV_799181 [Trichonephila clavipes]
MYYEGEQIYPDEDPCLICLCNQNWTGINSSSCRQHDCMLERDARKLKQGCIPIYHEKTCCPIDYHCATRKTTRRKDRRVVRQALVDPTVTRSTIRADVGVAIVPQTISRHVAKANHKSKRPFRALPLTPEHRQLRLQWCQARSMWNVTDWQKVVFSD